jgi:hypothetical protein
MAQNLIVNKKIGTTDVICCFYFLFNRNLGLSYRFDARMFPVGPTSLLTICQRTGLAQICFLVKENLFIHNVTTHQFSENKMDLEMVEQEPRTIPPPGRAPCCPDQTPLLPGEV